MNPASSGVNEVIQIYYPHDTDVTGLARMPFFGNPMAGNGSQITDHGSR